MVVSDSSRLGSVQRPVKAFLKISPRLWQGWRSPFPWGIGLLSMFAAIPALSAEVMTIVYGPIKFAVPVQELENYAKTGKLQGELSRYGGLVSAEQLDSLREALQQRVEMSPTLVSQLAYSKTGAVMLRRLGGVIKSSGSENGATALRATVVQAAASPEGLTLLNLLRKFPTREVQVDVNAGMGIAQEVEALFAEGDRLALAVEAEAQREATQVAAPNFQALENLQLPGSSQWQSYEVDWQDESRDRPIPVDFYIPEGSTPAPLVLISHGIASNRHTLAYLAKHLVSHGIAVAVPEHVGSNNVKFQQFFDGVAGPPEPREALDRPLDAQFILNRLTQLEPTDPHFKGKINLDHVTVIGQSFGGYTALALGGAELNFSALNQACINGEPRSFLNLSLLLQCQVGELRSASVPLADPRIKAVLAVNPLTSKVFNQAGLAKVKVPTMIVSGSADFVVPPSEEQLRPFTWLMVRDRYLVLMRNATHFSTLAEPGPNEKALPIPSGLAGPDPKLTQRYLAALSVAFVKAYGAEQAQYKDYLNAAYAQYLSQPAVPLSLVREFAPN